MITDEQVRKIALFFLFTLMDEKVALQAAHKTVAAMKASPGGASQVTDVTLIQLLRKNHTQHRRMVPRNRLNEMPKIGLVFPSGVEPTPWFKFQRDNADNEVITVALAQILGFSDEVIAEGLNVSLGTSRYRVGKGLRQLGSLVKA